MLASVIAPPASGQWQSNSNGIHYVGGNVGVGVTAPSAPLQVESSGTIGGWNGTLSNAWIQFGNRYMDPNEMYVDGNPFYIATWSNHDLRVGTNGTERLRIKSNGHVSIDRNLGIGVENPGNRLHVRSRTRDAIAIVEADPGNQDEADNPVVRLQQDGGAVRTDLGHEGEVGATHQNTLQNAFYVTTRNDGAKRPLQIGTRGKMHLTMRSDGKIGVGTTSPTEALTVAGKALAEEVIVKPQSEWSDVVFQESYDLPTLKEVASFIEQKGHLPDVPSVEAVKEDGIRLGEMDATLLQKVEELMLYAIEQKERADRQSTRTDRQARQIDSLRAENRKLRRRLQAQAAANQRQQEQLNRLMQTVQKEK